MSPSTTPATQTEAATTGPKRVTRASPVPQVPRLPAQCHKLCVGKWYVSKLCVSKWCVGKLCVGELCVSELCVVRLCVCV